ncbi:unnamed protein product [Rotaria sp. Silwood1]|nr:unnamed protein product [Rotaria sp. Silwood1]CAF4657917.1 unnamed protein product [Rotaria sp. Silwood1]
MTPVHRKDYEFGTPRAGFYREILNSDAEEYGGTGEGNLGGIHTEDRYKFQWPYTLKVNLPPLAVNIFIHEIEDEVTNENKTEQIEDAQQKTNEVENEIKNEETQTITPEEMQPETQNEVQQNEVQIYTETDTPEIIKKETEQPN